MVLTASMKSAVETTGSPLPSASAFFPAAELHHILILGIH